jgi:hypothetical protein
MHAKIGERIRIEMHGPSVILRLSRVLLAALALCLYVAPCAHAQYTTGTISGVITDPANAVIPGAAVELMNLSTDKTTTVTTSDVGA